MPDKPYLSVSRINMLSRCGEQFRRVYIEGERQPPGVALVLGKATHKAVEVDLTHKLETGKLLPDSDVRDIARDAFNEEWQREEVAFNHKEEAVGRVKVKGIALDQSVALSEVHHSLPALEINPVKLEWQFTLEQPDHPFNLYGFADVVDNSPKGMLIRDTKTAGKKGAQILADQSLQLTLYDLAATRLLGEKPVGVVLDELVKPSKTLAPRYNKIESSRTADDHEVFMRRFENACEVIEKEAFTPANPERDYWCSAHWCGFASTCPYFNGKKQVVVK